MSIRNIFLGVLACMAVPGAAGAQTITFDSLTGEGEYDTTTMQTYSEGGLTFTTDTNAVDGLATRNVGSIYSADQDGRVLLGFSYNDWLNFGLTNGGVFNLISLDLADSGNFGFASNVDYRFVRDGETTYGNFTLDSVQGLQTFFTPSLTGISSFGLYASDNSDYQLDNVRVSAVPEPGVWATMILGFGAVGFAMRRRRKVQPAVSFA